MADTAQMILKLKDKNAQCNMSVWEKDFMRSVSINRASKLSGRQITKIYDMYGKHVLKIGG